MDNYYLICIKMKKENKNKKTKKVSNEDLAVIVSKGFSDVDEKFKEVHKKMDKGFSDVNEKFKDVHKEIEDLAIMTGRGFEDVNNRFKDVDKKFEDLEEKLSRKIDGLSNRIDDLSLNRATREELKILSIRLEKVEEKVFK